MKKLLAFIMAIAILNMSVAITPPIDGAKPMKATEIMIPFGKTGQTISLMEFSKMKPAEYEKLANVKLKFFERIAYKITIGKLKKSIAKDGTITNLKVAEMFLPTADDNSGFHIGGYTLGLLLGPIGVLIAYIAFSDENKSNRIRWAWRGLLSAAVIVTAYLASTVKKF